MRLSNTQIAFIILISVIVGYLLKVTREGFQLLPVLNNTSNQKIVCPNCQTVCPECPPMPDMSKYVLKTSVPPCPTCPDLSYIS